MKYEHVCAGHQVRLGLFGFVAQVVEALRALHSGNSQAPPCSLMVLVLEKGIQVRNLNSKMYPIPSGFSEFLMLQKNFWNQNVDLGLQLESMYLENETIAKPVSDYKEISLRKFCLRKSLSFPVLYTHLMDQESNNLSA